MLDPADLQHKLSQIDRLFGELQGRRNATLDRIETFRITLSHRNEREDPGHDLPDNTPVPDRFPGR